MKERTVYLNGEIIPESQAKISIFDAGFRAGDGVYEMTRTYRGIPFRLDRHLKRLYSSMRYMQIDCGMALEEMERITLDVVERNSPLLEEGGDYQIWHNISRGADPRSTHGVPGTKATVVVYCIPLDLSMYARHFQQGAHLVTPSVRRTPSECLDSRAKITNKSNHILANLQARLVDPGCYPLMLDVSGYIAESSFSNFFAVSGDTLLTPGLRNVLEGVTRIEILDIASEEEIEFREVDMTVFDAVNADEAFLSTTSFGILPVGQINGQALRQTVPGPVTSQLLQGLSRRVGMDVVEQVLRSLNKDN
jgi:branched-chain amino acid aminotransferase